MSMFSNLAVADDVEESRDSVGSQPISSGVYPATIKACYVTHSKGGAMAVNLHLDLDGRELRNTVYITSGDKKGNSNTYTKQDGTKAMLPGFDLFRSLCLMTVGREPAEIEPENGIMKIWDRDQNKEVPQEVPIIKDLTGATVQAGLLRKIVDKNVQADDGSYVPSGETREIVEIDKFFHAETGQTVAEARANTSADFINTWSDKWTGVTVDKATKGDTAQSRPQATAFGGTPAANSGATAPKASLFG